MRRLSSEPVRFSSVRADEILSLREFGRRLKIGPRLLCEMQRNGFPVALVGRTKYIVGRLAMDWFAQQTEADTPRAAAIFNQRGG